LTPVGRCSTRRNAIPRYRLSKTEKCKNASEELELLGLDDIRRSLGQRGMSMTYHDDPEIERSPLSGPVTRDEITVSVEIYRMRVGGDGWSLEVVDDEDGSTVWDETFPTDRDAYEEFQRALEAEGLPGLLEATSDRLH
jgi:hypothetical protein